MTEHLGDFLFADLLQGPSEHAHFLNRRKVVDHAVKGVGLLIGIDEAGNQVNAELLAPLVSKETVQDVVFPILPVDRERVEEAHSPDSGEEFSEPLVLVEVDIPLP